ncbi:MAG: hypothetical protein ACR2PK_11765 [Acidimicrobiales bacterium]
MESTWAPLKREIQHMHGDLETMTRTQLRAILFAYIEKLLEPPTTPSPTRSLRTPTASQAA